MRKRLVAAVILLFCLGSAFAQNDFPSYQGFVNDYAGILSLAEKQQLDAVTLGLKQSTGAELAVAIVKSVAPLDSKLYAVKLFEKWGIGEKGKDNGVLLLVAIDERRVEIEVGYGLEGVLTDAMSGRILDSFAVPNFRRGEMGEGILQTAKAISRVISGEEVDLVPAAAEAESKDAGVFLIFVIAAVILLGILLKRAGSIVMGIFGAVWGSEYGITGAITGALLGLFFGFWGLMFFGRGGGMRMGGGGGFGGFGGGRSGGGGAGRGF